MIHSLLIHYSNLLVLLSQSTTVSCAWSLRVGCFYSLGFVLINYSTYGVKLNLGFFTLCSKAFSQIILSVIFRASNHQLVDKKELKLKWFKLSNLNSNLALTLGYLNPALNNSAMASTLFLCYLNIYWQKYTVRAEFHVKTLPESPPIKGLFSKCSTNSLKHEKVPIPNLYCEPSQPIWKCFTELAHLKKRKMKINPAVLTRLY